jgi:hypothetical protein
MDKTGIEVPAVQDTGIDKEHVKIQLAHQIETTRQALEFKDKWLEKIFSSNFLVFVITVLVIASGFVFMSIKDVLKSDIVDYWKLILPVVTTYIGYAIGKGKQAGS